MRGNKLIETKANAATIGMAREKFTDHQIELQKDDMLYIFTDGYADQKGGPEKKKFFNYAFKELIASNSHKDTAEQKIILKKTLLEWRKDIEQVDDVLVIGIRV